jgi:nucleotide-binding universal stress UspA family protein
VLVVRAGEAAANLEELLGRPAWRPRRMVVALDGSTLAESALEAACHLAEHCSSEVQLLSAFWDPTQSERLRFYLGRTARRLQEENRTVSWRMEEGPPAEVILECAQEARAQVLALATHAHTGARRRILGSVADRVLQECRTPVLLTNPYQS